MFWMPVRYPFCRQPLSRRVSLETSATVVNELASRGYNAEREAVTLLANAPDPETAIERDEVPSIDYDYCKGCGVCATECPVDAISMEREEK